jgi:hypothetical protein
VNVIYIDRDEKKNLFLARFLHKLLPLFFFFPGLELNIKIEFHPPLKKGKKKKKFEEKVECDSIGLV